MKTRSLPLFLAALLVLSGCSFLSDPFEQDPVSYTAQADGRPVTVVFDLDTFDSGTLVLEQGNCKFRYSVPDDVTSRLEISFPDGVTRALIYRSGLVERADGTPEDAPGYPSTEALADVISEAYRANVDPQRGPSLVVAILLIFIGVFHAMFPEKAWYLFQGWLFRDRHPTDLAVRLYQIGGSLLAVAGIVCAVIAILTKHWL